MKETGYMMITIIGMYLGYALAEAPQLLTGGKLIVIALSLIAAGALSVTDFEKEEGKS